MKLVSEFQGTQITVYTIREFEYDGERRIMLENPFLLQESFSFGEFENWMKEHPDLKIEFE